MDSGCCTDPERESSGSSGRSFSTSSNTNAPSTSLLSPRPTSWKPRPSAGQVLLEEVVTDEYQPTMEEQIEYAATIGIDPDLEPELMHLAVEGLRAALPPYWRPVQVSTEDDEDLVYYYNSQTGQSTWDHPRDEQFRQLVVQERARLRSGGQSMTSARVAEAEKRAAAMQAELRSRLAKEEAELRAEMRARIAEEENQLRSELRAQILTDRRSMLQKLEQEAEELRAEQRRLLELEIGESRVEAMAQLAELRAEIEQLKQTKAAALQHDQVVQKPTPMQAEETPALRARPRCPRNRTAQRCVSVDEAAVAGNADEDFDDRSSGSRAGALSVDVIGRARSFLSRHLSSDGGFVRPNPPEPAAEAASSRKRPQLRACRALNRASPSGGEKYPVNGSLDGAGIEAVDNEDASMCADSAKLSHRESGQDASAALAAELRKLHCGSLPSLAARSQSEETSCSESSEQPPKAKQDRPSASLRRQSQQQQQLSADQHHHHHHHRSGAPCTNSTNPRRQRIDWRKVGEKSDSQAPQQQQQQQQQHQSTESKLAQHKAWLHNFASLNRLPPSGGRPPLTPQGQM